MEWLAGGNAAPMKHQHDTVAIALLKDLCTFALCLFLGLSLFLLIGPALSFFSLSSHSLFPPLFLYFFLSLLVSIYYLSSLRASSPLIPITRIQQFLSPNSFNPIFSSFSCFFSFFLLFSKKNHGTSMRASHACETYWHERATESALINFCFTINLSDSKSIILKMAKLDKINNRWQNLLIK